MSIQLLHNNDIDLFRWDEAIIRASNSRIYAESWYLDIVHPDWMGIVYGDYDYVMPVIVGKKWGISYVFQPTFAQQHGIFPTATPVITLEILDFLKQSFAYINLSMNAVSIDVSKHVKVEKRSNYILSLHDNYKTIQAKYNAHAKRYVKKAWKNCDVSNHVNVEEYLNLKEKFGHDDFPPSYIRNLRLIIINAIKQKRGFFYGAFSKRNELMAVAFFLVERRRITYLNSVSTDEGKANRAMYAIIDHFIQEYAGSDYLLDFEGSNIEGIARFFRGFGAQPEIYQHIHYNRLPWYLKLIKK